MKTILVCFVIYTNIRHKTINSIQTKNVQEVLEPIQKFYKPCTLLFWGRISRGRRPRNLSKEWIQHFIIVSFCNTKMKYTNKTVETFIRQAYSMEYNTLHFFRNNNYINPCKSPSFVSKSTNFLFTTFPT